MNRKYSLLIWTLCFLNLAYSYPNSVNYDAYRKAAIENGMDPDAVVEVMRSGQPVVKIENDEKGERRTTTTYSMQSDGTVSRHTRTEYRPSFVRSVHSSGTPLPAANQYPRPAENSPAQKARDWEWTGHPTGVQRFGEPSNQPADNPQWNPNFNFPVFTYSQPGHGGQGYSRTPEINTRSGVDSKNTGSVTKTYVDDDNTRTTTVYTSGPTHWQSRTITYPWHGYDATTAETTKQPKIHQPNSKNPPENLPNLDDFLKTQYATTTQSPQLNRSHKPVTQINIDDLPITEVIKTGEPANEHGFTTETKSYHSTIYTNGMPTSSGFSPSMKDMLEKAGIDPNDALASDDGTVTKTRRDPDGKVITTTYRISTRPTQSNVVHGPLENELPQGPYFVEEKPKARHALIPSNPKAVPHDFEDFSTENVFNRNWHENRPGRPSRAQPAVSKNPIDEFLALFNMTAAQITAANGDILKQIVDENGRVLTATFVLSSVRTDEKTSKNKAEAPIK